MPANSSHAPRCAVVATQGRSPRLRRSSRSGRSTSSKGWDRPNWGTRTDSRNERALCMKLARANDSAVACETSRCRAMLSVARRRRLGRQAQSREPSPLASVRIREKPSLPSRRAKPYPTRHMIQENAWETWCGKEGEGGTSGAFSPSSFSSRRRHSRATASGSRISHST